MDYIDGYFLLATIFSKILEMKLKLDTNENEMNRALGHLCAHIG